MLSVIFFSFVHRLPRTWNLSTVLKQYELVIFHPLSLSSSYAMLCLTLPLYLPRETIHWHCLAQPRGASTVRVLRRTSARFSCFLSSGQGYSVARRDQHTTGHSHVLNTHVCVGAMPSFLVLVGIGIQAAIPGRQGGQGGCNGTGGSDRPSEAGRSNHGGVYQAGEAEGAQSTDGRQVCMCKKERPYSTIGVLPFAQNDSNCRGAPALITSYCYTHSQLLITNYTIRCCGNAIVVLYCNMLCKQALPFGMWLA